MRRDSVKGELITPVPLLPLNSAIVRQLVDDLSVFFDDGGGALQHMVARLPLFFEVRRAYVARVSPDGARFSVTQASQSEGTELLGYTQSVARLPAYVRGALRTGVQAQIRDIAEFPLTPQQRRMIWYEGVSATVVTPIPTPLGEGAAGALVVDAGSVRKWEAAELEAFRLLAEAIGARFALAALGDHLTTAESWSEDLGEEFSPATAPAGGAALRLNLLSTVVGLLEEADDPVQAAERVAAALSELPFLTGAQYAELNDADELRKEALAMERIVVRERQGEVRVVLPLVLQGERFGTIAVVLARGRLAAEDEQFLRTVGHVTSRVFAGALRRQRPRQEALTDLLTGLPNFRGVHETLVEAVHAAKSSRRPLGLWLLDVEGLEDINRTHGYAVGDDCVGFVGHSLRAAVAPRGAAGRVRGGSFLCVFPGATAEEAAVSARIFLERIARGTPGHLPAITLSIGVSGHPHDGGNADELLRYARLALYAAKRDGRNQAVVARSRDERWVRDARAAFVRIITDREIPAIDTRPDPT